MGFQGMGSNPGVVTPDIVEKHIPADDLFSGSKQEFNDGSFFFGEANFLVVITNEHLGAGLESVRANFENCVFALLMLAQMRPDTRQQNPETERLGHIIIGTGIEA